MSGADATVAMHASAVAWCGRGILLSGEPGSGKSTLVADLLGLGGYLVADDLVRLCWRGGRLHAVPCAATGLIEVRGGGIFRIATMTAVPVSLHVELTTVAEGVRLPERAVTHLAGGEIPLLRSYGLAAAQILLALVAQRTD